MPLNVTQYVDKIVGRYASRVELFAGDMKLEDTQLFVEAVKFLGAWFYDVLSLESANNAIRRMGEWLPPHGRVDLFALDADLRSVDHFLIEYGKSTPMGLRDFQHLYPTAMPYMSMMREVLIQYLDAPQTGTFRILHNFCHFLLRLHVPEAQSDDELKQKYTEFEEGLRYVTYDKEIISDLNDIAREIFTRQPPVEFFLPKHGPGATYECKRHDGIFAKYRELYSDQLLEYLQKDVGAISSWTPYGLAEGVLDRTTKIVYVPKSLGKRRIISAEPTMLQYFQQGVALMIKEQLYSSFMKHHICFEKQELSRDLARSGSILGEYATIDLTDASDSITLDLVKGVFRGTWLLRFLLCTRSRYAEFHDGSKILLRKFAPMGSAVCFPIESTIFALICCYVQRKAKVRRPVYRVYGDDIIVPQRYAQATVDTLKSLSFTVNENKSFLGEDVWNFREACGGEYLNGVDVTPIRVPRFYRGFTNDYSWIDPTRISSLLAFHNESARRGYLSLRKMLRSLLSNCRVAISYKNPKGSKDKYKTVLYDPYSVLPFSEDGNDGIWSEGYHITYYRHKCRYNKDLQCLEYKTARLVESSPRLTGEYVTAVRYWEELRLLRLRQLNCKKDNWRFWDEDSTFELLESSTLQAPGFTTWKLGWKPFG